MTPGTQVMKHTAHNNQRLKIHCGLRNPAGVELHIANHSMAWVEGRCLVIDDSFEHSISFLPGQLARAILQIKISHPDLAHSPLVRMGEQVVRRNGELVPVPVPGACAATQRNNKEQEEGGGGGAAAVGV